MAVYTHLTSSDISALLEHYDIGELQHMQGIAEGVENSNFLITTTQNKYILTLYEKRVQAEDLPYFLGIMEWLADRNIPCPRPLHRRDGALFAEFHGKQAAIVSFLNGKSISTANARHMSELGEHMARMHQAAEGYTLSRANDLSIMGWEQIAKKILPQLDRIHPGLAELVETELAFLKQEWPKALPSGVIHADLFKDNVFFEGDALTGIIDFYFACNDFFMYELAIVLNAWCFPIHHEFNVTLAANLLKGYHGVRAISEDELEALPVLARGAALRFLLTRAHDWLNPVEGAIVTPKDPLEYMKKLNFHRQITHHLQYGL